MFGMQNLVTFSGRAANLRIDRSVSDVQLLRLPLLCGKG